VGRRPAGAARQASNDGAPVADIRMFLADVPTLKALDPPSARWIKTLIRVSSSHPAMTRILDVLERLQDHPFRTNAVILGEPGTGKDGLARALGQLITPGRPLVRLDVVGFSEEAALAALCGQGRNAGAAEQADRGLLVIEEITALPPRAQEALLRLLKAGKCRRVGAEKDLPRKLMVNVIALSDVDIAAAVSTGQLRHDLYWRLARVVLWLPPLRERAEDVGPAAIWMGNRILAAAGVPLELRTTADVRQATEAERRRSIELEDAAVDALTRYAWPGNLRELEAVVERAILLYRSSSKIGAAEIQAALAASR
jgi:DNA-binding NtrC family response regulator